MAKRESRTQNSKRSQAQVRAKTGSSKKAKKRKASVALDPEKSLAEVQGLLRDKVLVLIGGSFDQDRADDLTAAFSLAAVDWIPSNVRKRWRTYRPRLSRANVALVIFVPSSIPECYKKLMPYCKEKAIPHLRCRTWNHANQLAVEIVKHCGDPLRIRVAAMRAGTRS
jgi:predicted amidohydrolase